MLAVRGAPQKGVPPHFLLFFPSSSPKRAGPLVSIRPAGRKCLRIIATAKIVARCRSRGRFETCPFFMNPTKGGFQTRPYSSCLLPTASFHGTHRQVGSVSASVSWHDFGFMKNSETVSKSPGYYHLVPVGRADQNVLS